jgi:hypothetical protein
MIALAQMSAAQFPETFVQYPPSQRPVEFGMGGIRAKATRRLTNPSKNAAWKNNAQGRWVFR